MSIIKTLHILSFALLTGCATSRTSITSQVSEHPDKEIIKVMVIALTPVMENRTTAEKELAYWLRKEGYEAEASVERMQAVARIPRHEEINKVTEDNDFDGIITLKIKDIEENSRYVSGTETHTTSLEETCIYNYLNAWNEYYVPGCYSKAKILIIETNLFESESGKLIYTATTEMFEASSMEQMISNLAQKLATNIKRSKVLTKSKH